MLSDWTVGHGTTTATARELAEVLGQYDVASLRSTYVDLVAILGELAESGGAAWPNAADDPIVVLLRAIARISILTPNARSPRAARLIDALSV